MNSVAVLGLRQNSIDIAMLQEHNVKDIKKLEYLNIYYHIILNASILLKGGTLIAIDKKLPSIISSSYMHPTSRLTSTILNIFSTKLYLVNIYAPSGSNKEKEREEFFEIELIQSLIVNTDNIILGGDWNCILSPNDSSRPENTTPSKTLESIKNTFRFKDILQAKKSKPEYTFYKNNYAARLDRIYVNKLFSSIVDSSTQSVSFSDHHSISVELNISTQVCVERPLWKLNVSLLKDDLAKADFADLWSQLQRRKVNFPDIISWWEELVKPNIKKFYILLGREQKKLQSGLINFLEYKLRKQYELANQTGVTNYQEIK